MLTASTSSTTVVQVPLNRVEGDLEIRVELEQGLVRDAWSSGTMYRGIENILVGRGPLDGLVITPRVCGICSTAHLTAAALALEALSGIRPPPDAVRIRNLALATEQIQSDMRHSFLMYAADFTNPAYQGRSWYEEASRRYQPLKGYTAIGVIQETKKVLEIVAILGGQWPHSSYMVPGGVTTMPDLDSLIQCRYLLNRYRRWYEERILGCRLERWLEVQGDADLDRWLEEEVTHRESELGFFLRVGRALGLDTVGRGHQNFVSFGQMELPADTRVEGRIRNSPRLVPAGFARGLEVSPLDQEAVTEHVACSWYQPYPGGVHPSRGETRPYATGGEREKYSWAKAPRYRDLPAETGPLAGMILSGNPLFVDLARRGGASALVRQLARLARPAELLPAMNEWLSEIKPGGPCYLPGPRCTEGKGYGLTDAPRGALGHWLEIEDSRIRRYQIITPTAWNGSPRDSLGVRGPWEEALVGTPVADPENPVELGHVVRSFDPCLVCTVHRLEGPGRQARRIL